MTKGPLAVRWGDWALEDPRAGAVSLAARDARERRHGGLARPGSSSATTGSTTAATRSSGTANARRSLPLAPGEAIAVEARVRAPIPPGRYRLALDLVAEHRAWFSELGSELASADVEVGPRPGDRHAELPGLGRAGRPTGRSASRRRTPRATRSSRARSPGTAASAAGGRARSRRTSPARAGCRASRIRSSARRCSTGVELERLPDVAGLPAFAAPRRRAVGLRRPHRAARPSPRARLIRARPRCGRRPARNTSAPSTSATTAATTR